MHATCASSVHWTRKVDLGRVRDDPGRDATPTTVSETRTSSTKAFAGRLYGAAGTNYTASCELVRYRNSGIPHMEGKQAQKESLRMLLELRHRKRLRVVHYTGFCAAKSQIDYRPEHDVHGSPRRATSTSTSVVSATCGLDEDPTANRVGTRGEKGPVEEEYVCRT